MSVARVKSEEPTADFDAMYRREIRPMIALALAMTGQRSVAEEIAQEGMLRAYRSWPSVGQMDRPGAWVRRMVINLAIDHRRRRSREATALQRVEPHRASALPGPRNDEFWAAVRALPDRQQSAVVLRYVEDLPLAEIAEILEIRLGTAKSTLFQARRALAAALDLEEPTDGDD